MPRGAPDYSNVTAGTPLHRVDDLGELAARLGSPDTHDRTGFTVFVDTFKQGLSDWQIALAGTGAEVALVSSPFRSGPFSVKLLAGSDGGRSAKIFRKFPYPQLNKYGLEFSWKPDSHVEQLGATLIKHYGAYDYEFGLRYVVSTESLFIKGQDGAYHVIDNDLPLTFQYAPFHTFKIVADLETDEFVRLIVNENVYTDIPYSAWLYATDDGPNVRVDIYVIGDAAYNSLSYVDDVILTQGEP